MDLLFIYPFTWPGLLHYRVPAIKRYDRHITRAKNAIANSIVPAVFLDFVNASVFIRDF